MVWTFLLNLLVFGHWPGQLNQNAAKSNVPSGTSSRSVVGFIAGERSSCETKPVRSKTKPRDYSSSFVF